MHVQFVEPVNDPVKIKDDPVNDPVNFITLRHRINPRQKLTNLYQQVDY